ncbi:hypothetical protein [Rhizobium sullae]|uniref:hypothetical protein n=1 Tax=Rhizobium sullae TaxID=50338 RepID=UPI0018E26364|nr:hypothetical protein [Rhizobium sullae]
MRFSFVDAALSGLDQRETITAPSLHDASLLTEYVARSGKLLQSMFDAKPAERYRSGK